MGISDELKNSFGQDFFNPEHATAARHHWLELCVCGHHIGYHSPSIGGTYRIGEPGTQLTMRTFHIGGTASRLIAQSKETAKIDGTIKYLETQTIDHEQKTITVVVNPTCPCTEFRPVAKVDRPNRYFSQRLPRDRADHSRHPMLVGLRAFSTHLSRRRAALSNPQWAVEELDRRFVWLDGARVCGLSRCRETADVWPVFIDGETSELRCAKHRPTTDSVDGG